MSEIDLKKISVLALKVYEDIDEYIEVEQTGITSSGSHSEKASPVLPSVQDSGENKFTMCIVERLSPISHFVMVEGAEAARLDLEVSILCDTTLNDSPKRELDLKLYMT